MHPPTLFALFPDVQLAYRVYNAAAPGLPLMMVMGWTGVKEDWDELPIELAHDRPVLVFDNRGMGESSIPEGPYSMSQLAGDALGLMDLLGWQRVHLMGISMGGMIAQTLALSAPHRIEKLVLGCTMHGGLGQVSPAPEVLMALQSPPQADMREMVRNFLWVNYTDEWIRGNPERHEKRIDQSMASKRSRRGMFHQMAAIMEFDMEKECAGIKHSTLVLHGDEDKLIPFGNAELLAKKIAGSVLHKVQKAGHAFWHMDEGESRRVIQRFLGNESSSRP